jgi:hypothetical protein
LALFAYLDRFRNSDGLPSALILEFCRMVDGQRVRKDVNYPTNMLFTGVLEAAAEL